MWSDLREASRVKGTKSGTPLFQVEDGSQDQYGGINRGSQRSSKPSSSCCANQSTTEKELVQEPMDEPILYKVSFTQEDPEQADFEEDNLNEDQKHWLSRVRMINVTRTINISRSKDALSYAMNTTTKGKEKLMQTAVQIPVLQLLATDLPRLATLTRL